MLSVEYENTPNRGLFRHRQLRRKSQKIRGICFSIGNIPDQLWHYTGKLPVVSQNFTDSSRVARGFVVANDIMP
jgi:hypothetical protein